MSTEALVKAPPVSTDQLDLVRRTVAKDATADELKLYLYDCERQGVHPLDKLIHFTKRSGKYTPITSIDFMRIRAADSGEYGGNDDPAFLYDAEEPRYPKTATVAVYRIVQGQRCAFTATARWGEYFPGDQQGWAWKKMPHIMLGKCAEALALRKAFPKQLAGLYAKEEMEQADKPRKAEATSEPIIVRGTVEGGRQFGPVAVYNVGGTKVTVADLSFDKLFIQCAERKAEMELEAVEKQGPKKKYLELIRILKIDGKPYLEAALEISIEEVKGLSAQDVGFSERPAEDEDVPF